MKIRCAMLALMLALGTLPACGTTIGDAVGRYGRCAGNCALKCLRALPPEDRLRVIEEHGIDPAVLNPPPEKVEPLVP